MVQQQFKSETLSGLEQEEKTIVTKSKKMIPIPLCRTEQEIPVPAFARRTAGMTLRAE